MTKKLIIIIQQILNRKKNSVKFKRKYTNTHRAKTILRTHGRQSERQTGFRGGDALKEKSSRRGINFAEPFPTKKGLLSLTVCSPAKLAAFARLLPGTAAHFEVTSGRLSTDGARRIRLLPKPPFRS